MQTRGRWAPPPGWPACRSTGSRAAVQARVGVPPKMASLQERRGRCRSPARMQAPLPLRRQPPVQLSPPCIQPIHSCLRSRIVIIWFSKGSVQVVVGLTAQSRCASSGTPPPCPRWAPCKSTWACGKHKVRSVESRLRACTRTSSNTERRRGRPHCRTQQDCCCCGGGSGKFKSKSKSKSKRNATAGSLTPALRRGRQRWTCRRPGRGPAPANGRQEGRQMTLLGVD